jgi:hypothetical protein
LFTVVEEIEPSTDGSISSLFSWKERQVKGLCHVTNRNYDMRSGQ